MIVGQTGNSVVVYRFDKGGSISPRRVYFEPAPLPSVLLAHSHESDEMELDAFRDAIEGYGYPVFYSKAHWPRDRYFHHNGFYVTAAPGRRAGEGGGLVSGAGFILTNEGFAGKDAAGLLSNLFGVRVEVAGSLASVYGKGTIRDHTDMHANHLPVSGISVIARRWYENNPEWFDGYFSRSADRVVFVSDEDDDTYAANFPVLPHPGHGEVAIVNNINGKLIQDLRKEGVEVGIPNEPFTDRLKFQGGMRCSCNTFHGPEVLDAMGITYYENGNDAYEGDMSHFFLKDFLRALAEESAYYFDNRPRFVG